MARSSRGDSVSVDEWRAVVIDMGSSYTKAGFGGEDVPSILFPTTISKQRKNMTMFRSVVEKGEIANWEDARAILVYCFKQINAFPDEHPVLLAERTGTRSFVRKQLCDILFKEFKVPAISFQSESVLALYSCGRTTGLVVDCGHGLTTVVPVVNGFIVEKAIMRSDVAGSDVTDLLMRALSNSERTFSTSADRRAINEVKEMFAFLSIPGIESHCELEEFELADGTILELSEDHRTFPGEVLFDPSRYLERESKGIQDMIIIAVDKCGIDSRKELLENIVLAGGTTLLEGFPERLAYELRSLTASRINIVADDDRDYSVWAGGSVISGLGALNDTWVYSEEYMEDEEANEYLFERRKSSVAVRH